MPAVKSERLVVPPKKWRGSASLRGYAGRLRAALAVYEERVSFYGFGGGFVVELETKTAKALLEIVCQAIHTEQGNGS